MELRSRRSTYAWPFVVKLGIRIRHLTSRGVGSMELRSGKLFLDEFDMKFLDMGFCLTIVDLFLVQKVGASHRWEVHDVDMVSFAEEVISPARLSIRLIHPNLWAGKKFVSKIHLRIVTREEDVLPDQYENRHE